MNGFAIPAFLDSLGSIEDLVAFVWFVLQRGAPVFETLLAVLILFSIVRFVAPEPLDHILFGRPDELAHLFPPTRSRSDDLSASLGDSVVFRSGLGSEHRDERSADAANVG